MDDAVPEQEILASTSPVSAANATPNTGAFFPRARHFTISGGTFTSNVTHLTPTILHRFRVIPLGDLDLLQEVRLEDASGVINAKLYHVLVSRRKSKMTAAVYRGRNGEEDWRQELQTYSGIRHPNIVQIYGVVSSPGIHATIFHDELISLSQYYDMFEDLPLTQIYLRYCKYLEYKDACDHLRTHGITLLVGVYTAWIRKLTGGLVIDVMRQGGRAVRQFADVASATIPYIPPGRLGSDMNLGITSFLDLHGLYGLLSAFLYQTTSHAVKGPEYGAVRLGAFVHAPRDYSSELAWVAIHEFRDNGWCCSRSRGSSIENGWTRFESSEIAGHCVYREFGVSWPFHYHVWLSQANHVSNQLQITSNYEEYRWIEEIQFYCYLPKTLPSGYLFLCPLKNLQTPDKTGFQLTRCQAYWSLNPSGTYKFSVEEALSLGFPAPVPLEIKLRVRDWEEREYTGLRQFHQAKGFDPDSQDVARHLGYPLYQVLPQFEPPFAHIEEEAADTEDQIARMKRRLLQLRKLVRARQGC